jgi:type I restriction enzyme, S subunit
MSNVNTITLDKIGKVKMCKRVLKEQTSEKEEVPFYKISTFGGKADTFISRKLFEEYKAKYSYPKIGDILISAAGTIGKTVIFDGQESFFQDSNIVWIDNNEQIITNSFLYYFYQTNPWQTTNGSTIKRIYNEDLRSIKITYPTSILVQQKIAKVLSDLDAKIELNNKINAELEAMAKTLYEYWFVQFDFPVQSKKNPELVEGYKSSGGKMVWNDELKREIPEGWEVKELGNELSIQRGISYKSSEIKGDGVSMISLNSFNLDGTYKPEGVKKYSGKYAEKNLISEGDLLIAITDVTRNADIIGKAIIVPDYYSELVISMDIAKVIPSKKLTESYLMMLFNSNHYHNYIKWYASGTIVLHLNLDGMFWYKAEIPPKELLYEFDKIHKPISKRIAETKKQNQELASLRDWLLPMLMNGQVTVGGYEVEDSELGMVAEEKENYKRS